MQTYTVQFNDLIFGIVLYFFSLPSKVYTLSLLAFKQCSQTFSLPRSQREVKVQDLLQLSSAREKSKKCILLLYCNCTPTFILFEKLKFLQGS